MTKLKKIMDNLPIVAIIRGVTPDEVVAVGQAIMDAGIQIIEVPLNSPDPLTSIARLSAAFPDIITGAGTVLTSGDVVKVKESGGSIIVSPNTDVAVIKKSIELDMVPMPGFQTVSEAFQAIKAGALYLKLFPAGSLGPSYVKAIKAVLPKTVKILAVGGAGAKNIKEWETAGVDGYGIGSEIYKAGMSMDQVHANAAAVVAAYQDAHNKFNRE